MSAAAEAEEILHRPNFALVYRSIKFVDYAAHGVEEYWIVDTDAEVIEQYLLADEEYRLAGKFTGAQAIASEVIIGLSFPANVLFDQPAAEAFYQQGAA